jgi:alkylation response protein AidB-like acyl-CoA dehydrogenase
LKDHCPRSLVRAMATDDKGFTPELWQQMSEMGWIGLVIPEVLGGGGCSFLDMVIVLEEMGRACLPGPFFSTVVLGGLMVFEAGSEEQKKELLPKIAAGRLIITLALTEASPKYSAAGVQTKARPEASDYVIKGNKLFVPDAHVSDYLICPTRTSATGNPEDGITLFLVDVRSSGVTVNLLKTMAGDKQCEVIFDNVKVPTANMLGGLNQGWPVLAKILEKATVARCAEMAGGCRQILETTVDYAKQRKAFGHPIGSFQAIQHYFADMLVETDGCCMMVYNAAWRLSEGLPATQEVSMTKALANQIFNSVAARCLQIHGAIGVTEDSDVHLYFKRAKTWGVSLGDTHFHLNKLADTVGI